MEEDFDRHKICKRRPVFRNWENAGGYLQDYPVCLSRNADQRLDLLKVR